tara:strand:- start:136 stop:330 length:195 start_codon:yes stop_codon:yes gene_type:complete
MTKEESARLVYLNARALALAREELSPTDAASVISTVLSDGSAVVQFLNKAGAEVGSITVPPEDD